MKKKHKKQNLSTTPFCSSPVFFLLFLFVYENICELKKEGERIKGWLWLSLFPLENHAYFRPARSGEDVDFFLTSLLVNRATGSRHSLRFI